MNLLSRLFSLVLRLVMFAVGLVFGALVLVAGLLLALFVVLLGLLRGKKPQMQFRMNRGSPFARAAQPAAAPLGEVVDIEAREVPDVTQTLPRDRR